jgi:deoxyribonuclease IV
MFGSHLSIAGSMTNALREAESLGMETVQVFTKNQQQWKAPPMDPAAVSEWTAELDRLGWRGRVVSHASYLINLASVNDELWEKSVVLMREEIERCEVLGIAFLVHHPGSFVGWTLEQGLDRIAAAYERLFAETKGYRTVSCLEGTTGSGSTIGGRFEDLARLRELIVDRTGSPDRIGFCLDTCHMHAAGYDLSSRESAAKVLSDFDRVCGMSNLRVMHMNDSKGKLASKLDRHEHIGEGWVGGGASAHTGAGEFSDERLRASGFVEVVNHPAIARVPKILETPKENGPGGVPMDAVNLRRLRSLTPGWTDTGELKPAAGATPTGDRPARPGRSKPTAKSPRLEIRPPRDRARKRPRRPTPVPRHAAARRRSPRKPHDEPAPDPHSIPMTSRTPPNTTRHTHAPFADRSTEIPMERVPRSVARRATFRRTAKIALSGALVLVIAGCGLFQGSSVSDGGSASRPSSAAKESPSGGASSGAGADSVAKARLLQQQGNLDAARAEFERAIAINPTLTIAYMGAADIDRERGDYRGAERNYAKAAELEPGNFDAQYSHGFTLQLLSRFNDAVRAYLRALTIRPDDLNANLNLGTAYLQLGEPAQGLAYAERAVRIDPRNAASRTNLGAIYASLGRHSEAVVEYQQASELTELTPPLLLNLADSLGKTDRHEEMVNTLRQVIEIEPSATAYERLGSGLFRLRYYDDALVAFRESMELDANYYPAINGVAVCRLNQFVWSNRTNDAAREEAIQLLRRSLQIERRQPRIADLLSRYQ